MSGRRSFAALLGTLLAAMPAAAQNALSIDPNVGLHVLPAGSSVPFGAVCSWLTCTPYQAGPLPRGLTHIVQVYGAPKAPYVLAIDGAPTRCQVFPFLAANSMALDHPLIVGSGFLGGALPGYPCNVGTDTWFLPIPSGVPAGLDVLMQGCIVQGLGWMSSFTPVVQAQTQ